MSSPSPRPTFIWCLGLACRIKFENYAAVTLGLEGEEGTKVSARLWSAIDNRLKLEAGSGVDCLLTRVQGR